jgi:hypothetical protein
MKHISYPSIEQFRNVCSAITKRSQFDGFDEAGEPIINYLALKPTLTFKGTGKLHGTNAGCSYNYKDGIWAQSRENIITPEKDNAGFAFFAKTKEKTFSKFFQDIIKNNLSFLDDNLTLTIFGEWVGKGIQKGVAIANLEKSFFIFGAKVSKEDDEKFVSYWLDSSYLKSPEDNIYNVEDYKTYLIDIDFNMPQLVQNKLIEMTLEVENECPIAAEFGYKGVGEGIVFTSEYKGVVYRFKSKGEKHSVSRVKTLNSVDVEKLNSISEFVDYAVTENRFNQGIEKVFGEETPDMKKIGELMKWMMNDILKEEIDTLSKNSLEPKEIGKYVSNKTRQMFFELLNKELVK